MGAQIHGLSLCSGVGCIDLGFKRFFGSGYSTVHYVEREAYCAEILARRMEEGHLDMAAVWDDITTFGGHVGGCDVVISGLPCQPYSVAGKGRGNEDPRSLWPHLLRQVRNAEPSAVFLENVPGFLKHFGPVYAGLREMGFDVASPAVFTAEECGAPHIRRRLFIFASHPERRDIWDEPRRSSGAYWPGLAGLGSTDTENANTDRTGSQGRRRTSLAARPDQCAAGTVCEQVTNTDPWNLQGERGGWLLDGERQTLRYHTDGRGDGSGTERTFWQAESPVVRMDDGTARRVDELRAIGNGVVPQVVERALEHFSEVCNGRR